MERLFYIIILTIAFITMFYYVNKKTEKLEIQLQEQKELLISQQKAIKTQQKLLMKYNE